MRFFLLLLLPLAAWAGPGLPLGELQVESGKIYREVEVRGYDPVAQRVLLRSASKAFVLPLSEIPPGLRPQIEAHFKRHPSSVSQVAGSAPAPTASPSSAPVAPPDNPLQPVIAAAETRMREYFRREYRPDYNGNLRLENRLDIHPPEQVAGWTGRYRVLCVTYVSNPYHPERQEERSERRYEVLVEVGESGAVGTEVTPR